MKTSWMYALLALVVGFLVTATGFASIDQEIQSKYLVRFKPYVNNESAVFVLEGHGLKVKRYILEVGLYVAEAADPEFFEKNRLSKLRGLQDIAYVERNSIWKSLEGPGIEVRPEVRPNDPFYYQQQGLLRLEPELAWEQSIGSYDIVVAVSDSGVDYRHPDLKQQLWKNPAELPNGVDDDRNGFIDDFYGWDFVDLDNAPLDDHMHGTHVAGILGAEGNNGVGVVGVNWHVRIMPVRFLDKDGNGTTEHGIDTILYAAKNGAKIINASWGSYLRSEALADAIRFAYSQGTLVIAAAGNDSKDTDLTPMFPAAYDLPGMVSVASSQSDGLFSSFSNWGQLSVDFAAPGSDILSTLPDLRWGSLSGTSMATPMASGVAALMLARFPQLSVTELRNALLNSVVDKPSYRGKLSTAGELNARVAMEQFKKGFQVWPSMLTVGTNSKFQFTTVGGEGPVTWSVSDPNVAMVDASGTLSVIRAGDVNIAAKDKAGKTSVVSRVKVIQEGMPGFPGCVPLPYQSTGLVSLAVSSKINPWEKGGAALSLCLPFMAGLWARRRRTP
jgi:subtilisin family serine protease